MVVLMTLVFYPYSLAAGVSLAMMETLTAGPRGPRVVYEATTPKRMISRVRPPRRLPA